MVVDVAMAIPASAHNEYDMKASMQKIFSPVLNLFESGEGEYVYKPSHRTVLIVMGLLFIVLASGSLYASVTASAWGGIVPIVVFLLIGIVCEIVGWLGSDRAVATIWKSK